MKICILTGFEDLLLEDSGASVRILNLARGLVSLGNEVSVIIPKTNETCHHYEGILVRTVRGICPTGILRIICRLVGVSRPASLYFYDPLFALKVFQIARSNDIIQMENPTACGLLSPIVAGMEKKALFIDCHDVFQASRVKYTSSLRRFLETFMERIAYRFADKILTVSERERKLLISYGVRREKDIAVIDNGVNTDKFKQDTEKMTHEDPKTSSRIVPDKPKVIFVGNMGYTPNREAVEIIAAVIAPHVRKKIRSTEFIMVGRNPDEIEFQGLTFTGVVDNIARVLGSADVGIAPLQHGSGTRLKILEYFSSGLPVVSTTVGVEGLEVENGENVLIEDDFHQFAGKIVKLLTNRSLALRLGDNARKLAVKKYDWKMIVSKLNNMYVDRIHERKVD